MKKTDASFGTSLLRRAADQFRLRATYGIDQELLDVLTKQQENAEIAVRARMEPVLLKGGETVKSLSGATWRLRGVNFP